MCVCELSFPKNSPLKIQGVFSFHFMCSSIYLTYSIPNNRFKPRAKKQNSPLIFSSASASPNSQIILSIGLYVRTEI